jgi:hypothetical protein
LTIVVDENVSELDGSDPSPANNVAVTVLLDLGRKGVVAETYQNLAAPVNPPSDFYGTTVSKDLLRLAALICSNDESPCTGDGDCGAGNTCDPGGKMAEIVNAFVFRSSEHGIAAALRGVLGATEGVPVVTKVSSVGLSDASDAAASVLRMKIKGELVACMQNGGSCLEDVFCCSGNCDLSGGSPGVCG